MPEMLSGIGVPDESRVIHQRHFSAFYERTALKFRSHFRREICAYDDVIAVVIKIVNPYAIV
jgi:hypothetical protein